MSFLLAWAFWKQKPRTVSLVPDAQWVLSQWKAIFFLTEAFLEVNLLMSQFIDPKSGVRALSNLLYPQKTPSGYTPISSVTSCSSGERERSKWSKPKGADLKVLRKLSVPGWLPSPLAQVRKLCNYGVLVWDSGGKAEEYLTSQTQNGILQQCHFSLSTELSIKNTDFYLFNSPTFPWKNGILGTQMVGSIP